jgi:hypothetical protein
MKELNLKETSLSLLSKLKEFNIRFFYNDVQFFVSKKIRMVIGIDVIDFPDIYIGTIKRCYDIFSPNELRKIVSSSKNALNENCADISGSCFLILTKKKGCYSIEFMGEYVISVVECYETDESYSTKVILTQKQIGIIRKLIRKDTTVRVEFIFTDDILIVNMYAENKKYLTVGIKKEII